METVNPSSNLCNVGRNWPKLGCVVCFRQNAITLCAKPTARLWDNSNRMHRQQLRRCP